MSWKAEIRLTGGDNRTVGPLTVSPTAHPIKGSFPKKLNRSMGRLDSSSSIAGKFLLILTFLSFLNYVKTSL